MGRNPKVKPLLFNIECSDKTLKKYDLPTPFPFLIHMRPEYTADATFCSINHTQPVIINDFFSEKEAIMEFMRAYGDYPVYAKPMLYSITELCPKCQNKGVPSFQLKSNDTSYLTSAKDNGKEGEKIIIKGIRTYWLTFKHGKERCWVQQWQGNIEGTFKAQKKIENIHPEKFMIGYALRKSIAQSK